MAERVRVSLADGSTGTVAPEDVEAVVAEGGKVEGPEQGQGFNPGAASLGFASGVSGGLLPAATVGALGLIDPETGSQTRQVINETRDKERSSYELGELGGALGNALLTAGLGGPTQALIPGRGLDMLGNLSARGALGRAAASGLEMGITGAAEQGLYGASQEASRQILSGDPDLDAEKIWVAGAKNAGLGFGLGAAFGAGTSLIGSGYRGARNALKREPKPIEDALVPMKAADDVAAESASKALATPDQIADDALATGAQIPDRIAKKYADQFDNAQQLASAWKNRAKLFAKHDDTIEQATRAVSKDLSEAVKAERVVDMASFGEAKATQMARLVPEANAVAQKQAGADLLATVRNKLDELKAAGDGGANVQMNRLFKDLEQVEKRWIRGPRPEVENTADLFMELDALKRKFGSAAKAGGRGQVTPGEKLFREVYDDIRLGLEREDVWGAAAAAQREINEATAKRLAVREQFTNNFLTKYDKDAFVQLEVADPAKVQSFVKDLTSAKNDLRAQSLRDYIERERDFLDRVGKHYELSAKETSEIAKAKQAFTQIEKNLDATAKSVVEVNQARRMLDEEAKYGVGGTIGILTDFVSKPMTTLRRIAQMEDIVQRVNQKVSRAAKVATGLEKPAPRTLPSEPLARRYDQAMKETARIKQGAADFADRVASTPLNDTHPQIASSLTNAALRTATFLTSRMPVQDPRPSFGGPDKPARADMVTMAKFVRAYEVAKDPTIALDRLASGTIRREDVEALKAVAPKVYEELRSQVVDHVAQRKVDGKPLSERERVRLGILLDAETDPALVPSTLRALQSAMRGPPATTPNPSQSRPGASRPINLQSEPSGIDRIDAR